MIKLCCVCFEMPAVSGGIKCTDCDLVHQSHTPPKPRQRERQHTAGVALFVPDFSASSA